MGGALSRGPLGEGCCDQVTRARRLTALFITRFKWIRSDSGFGARRRGQRQRQHNANAHEGDGQLCNRSISGGGGVGGWAKGSENWGRIKAGRKGHGGKIFFSSLRGARVMERDVSGTRQRAFFQSICPASRPAVERDRTNKKAWM